MPDQLSEQIQRIARKLRQAAEQQRQRVSALEKLQEENRLLKEKEKELLQEVRHLKEQVFLLKASAEPLNETDKKSFEEMINEYLYAIDKCIAKLKR